MGKAYDVCRSVTGIGIDVGRSAYIAAYLPEECA